ncbi:phospholipid-transporting ATPase VD [Microplitis demolitor]|uniref:phospholipid-transporting ATPase VD n=1 Tax=Microplitis demolitor TaxID=69319 RepID=UPI0004CD22E3|nr:phospholipid-transporting ATPase VD [Microplitis demolitor]
MSESRMQVEYEEVEKTEEGSLYVFPTEQGRAPTLNPTATRLPAIMTSTLSWVKDVVESEESGDLVKGRRYAPSLTLRTHARSASHAGVLASPPAACQQSMNLSGPLPNIPVTSSVTGAMRPSALKKPGHQRAFSQGQVVDIKNQSSEVTGHSRVGSRTDFILPPGHRDEPRSASIGVGGNAATKTPSFRGHARQASRSESIYTIRRSAAPPLWRRICAHCFGSCKSQEESRLRTIVPNHLVPLKTPLDQHPNGARVDNRVRTTKYTILSFLPRNLLEQFHRVANLYFIFIVLLNWVPAINAFGKEIAMIPVLFVLGVTAIKDFFEDRRRLASDRRVNNSMCRVYVSEFDRYAKVAWKDIKVGDIVHLSNNEVVPADILLLRSSDPQGFAFLDTCNLDGETNLKQRQVVRGFLNHQNSFQPSKFRSVIEIDAPTTKIYRFYGAVVHPDGSRVSVTTENLLLRECLLKNTDFVEGIVVYAGHETKAMLNNGGPRYKRSRLERKMNTDIIWCVVILLILCVIGAVGCRVWLSIISSDVASTISIPFLSIFRSSIFEGVISFGTFIIILQVMIPLSLYVTMEMAKVGQVYHIGHDVGLFDEETQQKTECRALNITEELGQIQYVFSDKTGTLTENKMIFRRCTIGDGYDYHHEGEDENISVCTRLKEDLLIGNTRHRLQEFLILLAICNTVVVNTTPHYDSMNSNGTVEEEPAESNEVSVMRYKRLKRLELSNTPASSSSLPSPTLASSQPQTPLSTMMPLSALPLSTSFNDFNHDNTATTISTSSLRLERSLSLNVPNKIFRRKLLNIATISGMLLRKHSPIDEEVKYDSNNSLSNTDAQAIYGYQADLQPRIYEAESPDELALVHAAKAYNIRLINRTSKSVVISLPNKSTLTYEILQVLPFDSTRKCMSVVVRHPLTNEIILYTKGADSTILSSLAEGAETNNDESSANVLKIRQQLYTYGRQGLRTLAMGKRALTESEFESWKQKYIEAELSTSENREKKLRECYSLIESNLKLVGATGIEDKLQEGVPEAIATLINAGIVVWVLTGDKPETAVNIAYSARLFSPTMQLLRLHARSKTMTETLIRGFLDTIHVNEDDSIGGSELQHQQQKRALVVDGKTLTFILDPRSGLTAPFLELTQNCSSVLACRATPLQKAYIVKIVKDKLSVRTLAIGDGANDVSMIQTADVGVGISGREGTQAVMASDFAIARFPMLARLLLLHGHWCYDRLARMILYFFYKNAMFVFLIFWYQFYCGFSGAVMIDQVYLMLYNLLFTSLPPLAIGVYDKIAPANILLSYPELYARGRLGLIYKSHSFWLTTADALYQSIVIFFVTEAAYHDSEIDIWEFGTTITTSCIIVMLIQASLEFKSWTIIHVATILGSLGIFFGFALIYNIAFVNLMGLPGSYWIMPKAITRHTFWLTVILISVLAILPRFVCIILKNTVAPDMVLRAKLQSKMKHNITTTTTMLTSATMRTQSNHSRLSDGNSIFASCSRSSQHTTPKSEIQPETINNSLTTIVA